MSKEKKLLIEWPEFTYVAGLDEVGRGCGAGPVVTAAVILPKEFQSPLIRDSKKLSEKQRNEAYTLILDNAIALSCQAGSVQLINDIGINKATFITMHNCIGALITKPEYLLVDGIVWDEYKDIKATLVPKGDDTYTCIAAAAIVAKVRRDEYMDKLDTLFPLYSWKNNKGYLTPDHITAIKEHGVNRYHRTLFVRNFVS